MCSVITCMAHTQMPELVQSQERRPQGADVEHIRFEDRTDLTPEQRATILAEREKQTLSTDKS